MVIGTYVVEKISIPRYDQNNQNKYRDVVMRSGSQEISIRCIKNEDQFEIRGVYEVGIEEAPSEYLCAETHVEGDSIWIYFNNLDKAKPFYTEMWFSYIPDEILKPVLGVGKYYQIMFKKVN